MSDQNESKPVENRLSNSISGNKITYTMLGFQSAEKSKSKPESLDNYLNIVYEKFIDDLKLNDEEKDRKISQLKSELAQKKQLRQEILSSIEITKSRKDDKEEDIEALKVEKIEIRGGAGELGETTPFIIGSFITILLTLYLFVFYSSSGYSALYGIKPGSLGFLNPQVFSDAGRKGGLVVALIILFPVIFLGLGYLIHDSLEKNKVLKDEGKSQQFTLISFLILITFIADAFIGYKISEGVHRNNFNAGITNEQWELNLIFSDINFYLVLILGFVVYVIWGVLLNRILSHPFLKSESEKTKLLLDQIDGKIEKRKLEFQAISNELSLLEGKLEFFDEDIPQLQKKIFGIENGTLPVSLTALEGSIGEFMSGWQQYTNGNNYYTVAQNLIEKAIENQTLWLERKKSEINFELAN
jgi:uncharacterized membrane protein (DUF106 family)